MTDPRTVEQLVADALPLAQQAILDAVPRLVLYFGEGGGLEDLIEDTEAADPDPDPAKSLTMMAASTLAEKACLQLRGMPDNPGWPE